MAHDPTHPVPERIASSPGANGPPRAPAPTPTRLAPASRSKPAAAEVQDSTREVVECIVFVVVLVLLLKTFVAEAFVIPTGSMATTLMGYQKDVTCPKCGFEFPVNCSEEGEHRSPETVGCICPNCRYSIELGTLSAQPRCESGDRVLVAKPFYETGLINPARLDVVVFKYPRAPQENYTPLNYIKRLIGLPGETIGIRYGKLNVWTPERGSPQHDDHQSPEVNRWQLPYMHADESVGELLRKESPFEIVRKPPEQVLAMRRIVYDNDHQASDLAGKAPPRWAPQGDRGWSADGKSAFHHEPGSANRTDWLRYRHILRHGPNPQLITDCLGYNWRWTSSMGRRSDFSADSEEFPQNWVGDLMLEGDVTINGSEGQLVLELSKGVDRFRARWDLASGDGTCTLTRLTGSKETVIDRQPTGLRAGGTHQLRFANVDERLLVWVDGRLPFGNGAPYEPAVQLGPTLNDLEPASLAVVGAADVRINHLRLWRDTYYTVVIEPQPSDVSQALPPDDLGANERSRWFEDRRKLASGEGWGDPAAWEPLRHLPGKTLYVQPGHYLCLGDNSPHSSDGRSWGLVPDRLLLGRALVVYYPVSRVGRIR
jgi:signal peptidase I